jgi:hypothetical protein
MDQPLTNDGTDGALEVRARDRGPSGALGTEVTRVPAAGRDSPGKSVGAVVAAARVLRHRHMSERAVNASGIGRAARLHRGTAYNILRTLQAEGIVGYDEATRTYAVRLPSLRSRMASCAAAG